MSNNYDDFSDIIENNNGVFGASEAALDPGLMKHDSVESAVIPEGAAFEFRCPGCGKPRRLIIEYPELIALKYFANPAQAFQGQAAPWCRTPSNWRYVQREQKLGLVQRCSMCPWHYPLRLDANEPERLLARARTNGLIPGQLEQQISQYIGNNPHLRNKIPRVP